MDLKANFIAKNAKRVFITRVDLNDIFRVHHIRLFWMQWSGNAATDINDRAPPRTAYINIADDEHAEKDFGVEDAAEYADKDFENLVKQFRVDEKMCYFHSQGSNYVCPSCFHLLRRKCFAPDGFDAVSVQNVGSTYIIVSWDLPTHSNGILINFSLYCNGALADVLPLTVISYNTTGLLPFTLYMYMSSSHAHRHCTPVETWCWASSVLQPACPVHCDSNLLSMRRTALLGDPLILSQTLMTLSSAYLLIRSLT
eukprot:Em0002g315a